jgi:integrase
VSKHGSLLAEMLRDRDKGLLVVTKRQTVQEYFTGWLEVMRSKIRPRTWKRYEQYVRLQVVPTLGKVELSKLTAQQLQALYAAKIRDGLSPMTVRHLHMLIHKALDGALRLDLVQRNVSELVDPPSLATPDMHVLSPEQCRALIEAARGDRFEALYVLALTTGMRLGELLALQWPDVNLDNGTLQIQASVYHDGSQFQFTQPKTVKSRRQVLLPSVTIDALRRHRLRQRQERLALGEVWQTTYDLVFPNTIGGPMELNHFRRREFCPLLHEAGLPRIRFHDLRHSVATLLFAQRINPKVVSELLGHSDIAITLGLYGHVTPPMQQEAANAMDALFADRNENNKDRRPGS